MDRYMPLHADERFGGAIMGSDNHQIAMVTMDGEITAEERDNRALMLIHSANNFESLLAALKAAERVLDNTGSPGGCDGTHHDSCEHCAAIVAARAAIKSAEQR